MYSDPILTIDVKLDGHYSVKGTEQSVNMICFHGSAQSELFEGVILPGGVDTQFIENEGRGQLSARYMLEGKDLCGQPCRIFIHNQAQTDDASPLPTHPRVVTDSKTLAYLEKTQLEGSLVATEGGVCIAVKDKTVPFRREEHILQFEDKTIYGEMYLPQDGAKTHPLLIASHGYNSCSEHMRTEMEQFAMRGIAVYCYDFCGGSTRSKSTGRTEEMSILTEQRDLLDVFQAVSALAYVDAQRIYLYGSSQGGFVSALAAPQLQDRIRGIFLQFPAFCIPDDWGDKKTQQTPETFDFMGMVIGRKYIDDLPDEDVFDIAARYKGPVCIFHGDADALVKLHYSERLANACTNAELHVYPGQGHGFTTPFLRAMIGKIVSVICG